MRKKKFLTALILSILTGLLSVSANAAVCRSANQADLSGLSVYSIGNETGNACVDRMLDILQQHAGCADLQDLLQQYSCRFYLLPGCGNSGSCTPGATNAPTAPPVVTQAPTAAETPAATKAPVATKAPAVTKAPSVTKAPTPTKVPTPTKAPAATETPDLQTGSFAEQITALVNQERSARGLSPVTIDLQVQACANVRAREIAVSFSHTRPNSSSCFTALQEGNVRYRACGENIAYGYPDAERVMQAWMNSSGHRANILNAAYTRIGVGYYETGGVRYWTQFFIG